MGHLSSMTGFSDLRHSLDKWVVYQVRRIVTTVGLVIGCWRHLPDNVEKGGGFGC